jgi:hypothetical protein
MPQIFVALTFKDGSLLRDSAKLRERLEELMKLEKRRLGFKETRLVFVGMANIAEYRWCPTKAILMSREDELKISAATSTRGSRPRARSASSGSPPIA